MWAVLCWHQPKMTLERELDGLTAACLCAHVSVLTLTPNDKQAIPTVPIPPFITEAQVCIG